VLILGGLLLVASIAGMFRNFLFTYAGEKFVARIRKKVCLC
jgi:ABC-type siderophore export system fused ATPase/permease subunit